MTHLVALLTDPWFLLPALVLAQAGWWLRSARWALRVDRVDLRLIPRAPSRRHPDPLWVHVSVQRTALPLRRAADAAAAAAAVAAALTALLVIAAHYETWLTGSQTPDRPALQPVAIATVAVFLGLVYAACSGSDRARSSLDSVSGDRRAAVFELTEPTPASSALPQRSTTNHAERLLAYFPRA